MAYLDALTAPSKKLVWFEESGHEPFVDEPTKFIAAMVDLVRPLFGNEGRAVGPAENSGLANLVVNRNEVMHARIQKETYA